MLSGSRAIVVALAAALLAAPLTGCNNAQVRVRLVNFGNGNTDGLWFWRIENGSYRRICRIDLSNTYYSGGAEVVDYKQTCLDGRSASVPWQAIVKRLPSNPQTVELAINYRRSGTLRAHRASAFNPSGESALSSTSLQL